MFYLEVLTKEAIAGVVVIIARALIIMLESVSKEVGGSKNEIRAFGHG